MPVEIYNKWKGILSDSRKKKRKCVSMKGKKFPKCWILLLFYLINKHLNSFLRFCKRVQNFAKSDYIFGEESRINKQKMNVLSLILKWNSGSRCGMYKFVKTKTRKYKRNSTSQRNCKAFGRKCVEISRNIFFRLNKRKAKW